MINWPLGQPSQVFWTTLPDASRSTNRWFAAHDVSPVVQAELSERDVVNDALQASHRSAVNVPSVQSSGVEEEHSVVVCSKPTGQRQLSLLPWPSTWRRPWRRLRVHG